MSGHHCTTLRYKEVHPEQQNETSLCSLIEIRLATNQNENGTRETF